MHRIFLILLVCFFWIPETPSCETTELTVSEDEVIQGTGTPTVAIHSFILPESPLMFAETGGKIEADHLLLLDNPGTHEASGYFFIPGTDYTELTASPDILVTNDSIFGYDPVAKKMGWSMPFLDTSETLNRIFLGYEDNISFTHDRILFDAMEFKNTKFRLFWRVYPY